MPQDALLRALENDARSQTMQIIKEAEDAAAVLIAQAEKEAGETARLRLMAMTGEFERRKAAAINSAKTRTHAAILDVRCSLIDEAFNGALQAVKALPKDEYAILLNRLLDEAMDALADKDSKPVALVAPVDAALIKSGRAEIRPDARVSFGIILQSTDGRVVNENTMSSRIGMVKPELMPILDKILFDKAKA
ncbi:MAG: hypothetical protein HY884_04700 [Deltaproteobacteria bacterium]|nr:hypothetical protein [Deltaproteobacteria bacterium]